MTISDSTPDFADDDLFLAILGPKAMGGPRRMAHQLLRSGRQPVRSMIAKMSGADVASAAAQAAELSANGVRVLLCDEPAYPDRLRRAADAPPALFYRGPVELLKQPSLGICGSRNASLSGLRAARVCGESAAQLGIVVVSGYAKGVDTESHLAALASGGSTVAILPEGIGQFRLRKEYRELPEQVLERMLVVSQFPPGQPWTVGAAMTRNQVIIGLCESVVAVEAGTTGGTLRAGELTIHGGRRLLVLGQLTLV